MELRTIFENRNALISLPQRLLSALALGMGAFLLAGRAIWQQYLRLTPEEAHSGRT